MTQQAHTLVQVGIDLIRPLPKTLFGNRYIVTLKDSFSKWPKAAPLKDKTAKAVLSFSGAALGHCSRTAYYAGTEHVSALHLDMNWHPINNTELNEYGI